MIRSAISILNQDTSTNDAISHAHALSCYLQNQIILLSPRNSFQGQVYSTCVNEQVRITKDFAITEIAENHFYVPEEMVCITLIDSPHPIFYDGRILKKGMLHFCSGKSIQLIGKNLVSGFSISIKRNYFFDLFKNTTIQIDQNRLQFSQFYELTEFRCEQLIIKLNNLCQNQNTQTEDVTSHLVKDVFDLIVSATSTTMTSDDRSSRNYIVNKGSQIILNNYSDCSFTVNDLVTTLKSSRRSVQYSFQEVLGITPSTYLRYVRLNAAYNHLKQPEIDHVNQIAIDCGFAHFSRFAQYYKSFFGELPSKAKAMRKSIGYV